MPELSLTLDPFGGLWPVLPAVAPTPADEPAVDFGALIVLQGLQEIQVPETPKDQPFTPALPTQPGVSPVVTVGLTPDRSGAQPDGWHRQRVVFDEPLVERDAPSEVVQQQTPHAVTPDVTSPEQPVVARVQSSAQPGVSPAVTARLKPEGAEERHVVSTERPAVPVTSAARISPVTSGAPTAPEMFVTPETPVAPEAHPLAREARRVIPTQPRLAPDPSVGLNPVGPEAPPVVSAEPLVVRDARRVIGWHRQRVMFDEPLVERDAPSEVVQQQTPHAVTPNVKSPEQPVAARGESSAQPGVSPAVTARLTPEGAEERHVVSTERPAVPVTSAALISPVTSGAPAAPEVFVTPETPVAPEVPEVPEAPVAHEVLVTPVAPEAHPLAREARRVISTQPRLAPDPSVGLNPVGPEARPVVSAEPLVVRDARRVIQAQPVVSPPVLLAQPGFRPDLSVGPKRDDSEEPHAAPAKVMPAGPAAASAPAPGLAPGPAPAPAPAPALAPAPVPAPAATAPAPLPAMVPTTDEGTPLMPRLVEMMRWQAQEGGGQAELRLRPEFLGAVTVSIVVERGAVKAIVSAETPAALEYLRAESSGLQEALEERGLTLDEFEVREESPLAERRRDPDDAPPRQETAPPAPRRRASDADGEAAFNVLM